MDPLDEVRDAILSFINEGYKKKPSEQEIIAEELAALFEETRKMFSLPEVDIYKEPEEEKVDKPLEEISYEESPRKEVTFSGPEINYIESVSKQYDDFISTNLLRNEINEPLSSERHHIGGYSGFSSFHSSEPSTGYR